MEKMSCRNAGLQKRLLEKSCLIDMMFLNEKIFLKTRSCKNDGLQRQCFLETFSDRDNVF